MPKQNPFKLEQALDRLLDALHSAPDLGSGAPAQVSQTLHECADIATELGVGPEELMAALKPRLQRAAARVPTKSREAYLRAITGLAIEAFIRDPRRRS